MAQSEDTNPSSSSSSDSDEPVQICDACGRAAAGLGPWSRKPACQDDIQNEGENVRLFEQRVQNSLVPYSDPSTAAQLEAQLLEIDGRIAELEAALASLRDWGAQVRARLDGRRAATQTCLEDVANIQSYRADVQTAETSGDMGQVLDLAMSMGVSVDDLKEDFARAAQLNAAGDALELRDLRRLQRLADGLVGGADVADAAVTARPQTSDAEVTADDSASDGAGALDFAGFAFSHEIKMDGDVTWVTVCTDCSGFRGDPSGRVVPAESAAAGARELPRPCIIARVYGKYHLLVLSVDGGVRFKIIPDINWQNVIWGLRCHGAQLCIAQDDAVTVADLSGHVTLRIPRSGIAGFDNIQGICVTAASVIVSSRSGQVAAVSTGSGQVQTVFKIPAAGDLRNMAEHGGCIFIPDWSKGQVHRVQVTTHNVVATHPTQCAGLQRFVSPWDVAVDSRGRLFVSENTGHSVRALDPRTGALLGTLGTPGQWGRDRDHLSNPWGLAVVTAGARELLIVADLGSRRLLVVTLL